MSLAGRVSPRTERLLGVLGLLVVGQIVLIAVGAVAPGLVRFPGMGPHIAPDTAGYLSAADDLPHVAVEWWGKILYVLILRVGMLLGAPEWTAVILQALVAAAAGVALVDIGSRLGSQRSGWIAAGSVLLNPQSAQWTTAVLTDSLFLSLMLLILWAVVRAPDEQRGWLVALALASAAALLRPNGLLAVASVVVLLIWAPRRGARATASRPAIRLAATASSITLLVIILGASPAHRSGTGGWEDHPLERLVAGEVIWGTNDWSRPMPETEGSERSLAALFDYAITSPGATLDIGLRRIVVESLQIRPHYPLVVNLLVGATMVVYLSAAAAGSLLNSGRPLRRPIAMLAIPMLAGIAMTWASPEGRFGWAFLVLLASWVGLAADRLLRMSGPATRRHVTNARR